MIKKFLSLGNQPLANDFKSKKIKSFYTLNLKFDNKSKLVSISKRIKKEINKSSRLRPRIFPNNI